MMARALFQRGLRPMTSLLHDGMTDLAVYSTLVNNSHIGIDFGSLNTYISVMENDTPRVIKTITSQLFINPDLSVENLVCGLNRMLGRKFDDPFIQKEMKVVPFNTCRAPNGDDAWVKSSIPSGEEMLAPTELLRAVLANCKRHAESYLHKSVSRAVITHPSHYSDYQLRQLVKSGLSAGFDKLLNIDETTAAAIAFGMNKKEEGRIFAVADIGHRKSDVSILQVAGNARFRFRAPTKSDMFLGGMDFDKELFNYFRPLVDLPSIFKMMLKEKDVLVTKTHPHVTCRFVEKIKKKLSDKLGILVLLPVCDELGQYSPGSVTEGVELSRSEFEKLVDHLIQRIKNQLESSLEEAGVAAVDVEEVILVGGVARIPIVREAVTQAFGKSPSKGVLNPEEAVALGAVAAIQAGHFGENAWND